MAMRQYIGARYVPRFLGEYDNTQQYEALDVVDNGAGTSYIARKIVPPNTPLTDTDYWFVYGASSGAIIALQNDMIQAQNDIGDIQGDITTINNSIGTINGNITSLQNAVSPLTAEYNRNHNRRFVTIADSYGNLPTTSTSWSGILNSIVGGDWYNFSNGSMGFYKAGSGMNALQFIQSEYSNISHPETITDIIINLGLNDYQETLANIGTAIQSLVSWLKSNFVNASIWFACAQNSYVFTTAEFLAYKKIMQLVQQEANVLMCKYMAGLEYICHDMELMATDKVHPASGGAYEIARGMLGYLFGNSYKYLKSKDYTWVTPRAASSTANVTIDGPITKLTVGGCLDGSDASLSAGTYLEVGSFYNDGSPIYGRTNTFTGMLVDNATNNIIPGIFLFTAKKLYFRPRVNGSVRIRYDDMTMIFNTIDM